MQNNFITNLLDLKGVNVTKFRNRKNRIRIHIELPVKEHTCTCCHSKTSKLHDYRFQLIKDIPINASSLLEVLCIDEFRGNAGNYKYQVSLLDGKLHKPIDIIECRHKVHLFSYFNKFSYVNSIFIIINIEFHKL